MDNNANVNTTTPNSSTSVDSIKNLFSSSIEKSSDIINNISSSVKDTYDSIYNGVGIYIGLIFIILLCFLIAYLLYYYITTSVFMNTIKLAEETKVPILCTEKIRYNFSYDKTYNGDRRSFTFWIYIHDMTKYKSMYKNVFNITANDTGVQINKASPYIFLDNNNNKMYVRFTSKMNETNIVKNYSDITESTLEDFMKQGITVPYIPLQRWVHIAIVCNANSYKNYMYAYVDGDLVNSVSTGEKDKHIISTSTINKDYKDLDLNVNGYLNIGGNNNDLVEGPGFSGLVSKITTYNYELNQRDIFNDYYKGPVGGILAKVGLARYGIRSPIYKI